MIKPFLNKVLVLGLPILIILIGVNYFGDAARLFQEGYEKKIVDILHQGKHATNIDDYDERIFQKEYIQTLNQAPEIVVLGSSRTMLVGEEHLNSQQIYNASVSGASIEDHIAIFQLFKEANKLPKKILLGIDPWTFNENNDQKRWQSIAAYYNEFKGIENTKTFNKESKYLELLSFSYFQASLKKVPDAFKGKKDPIASLNTRNESNTKLINGVLSYSEKYRATTNEEVTQSAKKYVGGSIYSIEDFYRISKNQWNDFTMLIAAFKANNIEVELFLAPYHPLVYDKVAKEYSSVLTSEKRVKEYATAQNIKLYGSFNPSLLNMDATNFYDGMHTREFGIVQIFKANLARE